MDKLFEKLGITPAPWKLLNGVDIVSWHKGHVMENVCRPYGECDTKLLESSPEMLEWLIKDLLIQDIMGGVLPDVLREQTEKKFGKQVADWIEYMKPLQTEIVEKATGKSWSQLKELINANTN